MQYRIPLMFTVDFLVGVGFTCERNRIALSDKGQHEIERAKRQQCGCCIILLVMYRTEKACPPARKTSSNDNAVC